MKQTLKNLLLIGVLISMPYSSAFAKAYARLGGTYSTQEAGSEGSESESKRMVMDIGGGHIWSNGATLGLLYATEKNEAGGASIDRKAYGPTVGWVTKSSDGPYVLFTYFLKVERSDNYEGSGMQLDLGYKFGGRTVGFAPQLTYRDLKYDKVSGASISPKTIDKKIEPLFVAWMDF